MQWKGRRASDNVDDRRGSGGGSPVGRLAGGGLGLLVIAVVVMLMGGDPGQILGGLTGDSNEVEPRSVGVSTPRTPEEDAQAEFTKVVLASTEDVWNEILPRLGAGYREPRMELFTGHTDTACGAQSAAVGPFYCPGDSKIYVDLSFFAQLDRELGAPGDFAQAYVIAHEVGHHVQKLLGITAKVDALRGRASEAEVNRASVRLELQADCFAGVWANRSRNLLEAGDLEEGLTAAAAIGDDRLQKESRGRIVPESFTHGTSAQRVKWFRAGFESGRLKACDTFAAAQL